MLHYEVTGDWFLWESKQKRFAEWPQNPAVLVQTRRVGGRGGEGWKFDVIWVASARPPGRELFEEHRPARAGISDPFLQVLADFFSTSK